MSEWSFWLALWAMLTAGGLAGVGLFLGRFGAAAGVAGLGALWFDLELEQQLQLFLFASGALLTAGRFARFRKHRRADAT